MLAAKLRNLLSQTIEQQAAQLAAQGKKSSSSTAQSLLNHASSFLPPLFNLPFVNLRSDIRNELLSDEKTASLLLGQFSRNQVQAAAAKMAAGAATAGSSNGPPPAHQSSSTRRNNHLDTLDLRFKTNPLLTAPPAPAHKAPPKIPEKGRSAALPASVLDLSGGELKRSTRSSMPSAREQPSSAASTPSGPSEKRSGKRIGSRIDALALNLQAKKLMEEKPEPKESSLLEQLSKSSKMATSKAQQQFEREMEKQYLQKSSLKALSALTNPPAAHSSASALAKAGFDPQLLGKSLGLASSSRSETSKALSSASSKSNDTSSMADQVTAIRQDLKKWLDEHPELLAANPTLAAAAAAAMASFTQPTQMSTSIPANVRRFARDSAISFTSCRLRNLIVSFVIRRPNYSNCPKADAAAADLRVKRNRRPNRPPRR